MIHNDSTETDEETKLYSNDEVDNRQGLSHKRIIRKPKYLSQCEIYNAYCLMMPHEEPETFCKAIQNEFKSHQELQTWTETELPEGIPPIETKWVFRIKKMELKRLDLSIKDFKFRRRATQSKCMYAPGYLL